MDLFRTAICMMLTAAIALAVSGCDLADHHHDPPATTGRDVLSGELDRLARTYPGAIGVVRYRGSEDALAARGVRRFGTLDPIHATDRMHIGSITKSMTATLIASLVDDGLLQWDDHPAATLAFEPGDVDPGYVDVTLLDLLHHRAGIPGDEDFETIPDLSGTPPEQRLQAAALVLAAPPATVRGTFRYSNAGYAIAAAMAEAVTGRSWESLLADRLAAPLGIRPVIGWPATAEDPAQPWGHERAGTDGWTAVDPAVVPALASAAADPAGNLSLTLSDLGRYMDLHLQAARGAPRLLQAATFAQLHAPVGSEAYACGLEVVDLGPDGPLLWHNGSNTFFLSLMYILPDHDLAVAIIINAGEEGAADVQAAVDKVARWYMDRGVVAPAAGG